MDLGNGCKALEARIELNELAGAHNGSSRPAADFAMPPKCCSSEPPPTEGGVGIVVSPPKMYFWFAWKHDGM